MLLLRTSVCDTEPSITAFAFLLINNEQFLGNICPLWVTGELFTLVIRGKRCDLLTFIQLIGERKKKNYKLEKTIF